MALTPVEEAQTRELLAQEAAILSLAASEATIISKLGAAKVNLSQLQAASSAADADLLLIRQSSTDKSIAGSAIKAYTKPDYATETVSGVVELATSAEAQAGTDTTRAVTPAGLAAYVPVASATVAGKVELATTAEVQTGTDTVRAITPAGRRADTATSASDPTYADNSTKSASTQWVKAGIVISLIANGYIKFPSWLGGLIIQWGATPQSSGSADVSSSFPITFPTAIYSLNLFPGTATLSICATIGVYTTSAFTYSIWNTATGVRRLNDAAFFIAIGK